MALLDMQPTDLAYAAGVIDSDGCITVTRGRLHKGGAYSYPIQVNMTQKSDEMPLWFLSTFGGHLRIRRHKESSSRFCDINCWELNCQKAADFLELIIPYLKKKKLRAGVAVRLARMSKRRGGFGYRYGGKPVTLEESAERERLALIIRSENHKSNVRVGVVSRWGVN